MTRYTLTWQTTATHEAVIDVGDYTALGEFLAIRVRNAGGYRNTGFQSKYVAVHPETGEPVYALDEMLGTPCTYPLDDLLATTEPHEAARDVRRLIVGFDLAPPTPEGHHQP